MQIQVHVQCASFCIIHLHLRLLAQILNLGLAKYDVGVGGGVLVNVRLVDDKEDVNWFDDEEAMTEKCAMFQVNAKLPDF